MEEKCFDTINSILMSLPTSAASSTTASIGIHSVNEKSIAKIHNCDQVQRCSMSLAEGSANDKSQHQLALNEVLDDESRNSGVLESFGHSSTASINVSDVNSGLESLKSSLFRDDSGDCSSTESCSTKTAVSRGGAPKNDLFKINSSSESYNVNKNEIENTNNTKNTFLLTRNELLEGQTNSVIVSAGGSTIYLETPVVDEQQHHIHHHAQIIGNNNSNEYIENTAKPKRLSDEFLLVEEGEIAELEVLSKTSSESAYNEGTDETQSSNNIAKIGSLLENDLQHDKMSFRLKKMNINNSSHESNTAVMDDIPSSSLNITYPQSMADIQSMDLIERRDFETEQRLTGGMLLKTSSLSNKNKLNLNLIDSCLTQQDKVDDCPSSSSSGRVVSSDSKCTYKDPSTTPTSSRAYNSRLTKSTAKINLCSTLSHSQQQPQPQLQLKQKTAAVTASKLQMNQTCSSSSCSSSSVIVEVPSSSNVSTSVIPTAAIPVDPAAELYSNSNSNDSVTSEPCSTNVSNNATTNSGSAKNCQQHEQPSTEGLAETGCSRTNALKTNDFENKTDEQVYDDDDAQPSTSSARCQYAPVLKNMRQVNASAQTNEKYLSRIAPCSTTVTSAGGSTGVNLSLNRTRRKDLIQGAAHLTRNSTSEEAIAAFNVAVAEAAAAKERGEYHDDPWADCEENSDNEEVCTCQHNTSGSSHGGSNTSLNETEDLDMMTGGKDADISNYIQMVSISEDGTSHTIVSSPDCTAALLSSNIQQRKRKYNESRFLDNDYNVAVINSGGEQTNSRKRIAYDYASTPRSSQSSNVLILTAAGCSTPTNSLTLKSGSPISRRTPRSIIPTRDNPPPGLQDWLAQFKRWSHPQRLLAVDRLIERSEPTLVRHMMKVIEPQFQRDFISLLPRELALQVLTYLDPMDLLRAAQTCCSWRFLCDDNLLWKEKCRKAQILTEPSTDRPKRGRAGNMPHIASTWKAAYMRQHIIEMNWRSRPIREPKVLKGHDDHVITCLQFSGNRIVSGSDDNTLKVWSAVTGRCLRTLVGHTGGVWSSQMSGNIIISGSTDRTLKVWDMETGQCVHTLLGHTSTVRCMHLHGKRVVSGSRDATLRVWDIEQGTCLHVLVGHLAAVRCVQYDGKLIVSGAYDYMVKIWHPERQECLHTLQGHTNRVYSLQFDGIHVVSGSLDTSIRVWDVETGNCKHTLMGHQSLTSGMELRQNILVSGNADSTVKVWDITTGQCLQTLSGPNKHQSAVTCLQFNSRFVVTSSDDGTVKLWDVKTGEFIRNLVALDSGGSGGVVWRIRANDTKLICAVGSRNGTEETKLMVLDFDVEGACVKCS